MMIELTDKEALVFRLLAQAGTWDIQNGSITVHFNNGVPMKAETREVTSMELSTPSLDVKIVI